jgi:hypothetical protein
VEKSPLPSVADDRLWAHLDVFTTYASIIRDNIRSLLNYLVAHAVVRSTFTDMVHWRRASGGRGRHYVHRLPLSPVCLGSGGAADANKCDTVPLLHTIVAVLGLLVIILGLARGSWSTC